MAFYKRLGLLLSPGIFQMRWKIKSLPLVVIKASVAHFSRAACEPCWHGSSWVIEFCQLKCPEQFQIHGGETTRCCSVLLSSCHILPPQFLCFSSNWRDAVLRPVPFTESIQQASVYFFQGKSRSACVFSSLVLDLYVWMMINARLLRSFMSGGRAILVSNLCLQRGEPCLIQRCCQDSGETETNRNVFLISAFSSFLMSVRADSVHNTDSNVHGEFLAVNI